MFVHACVCAHMRAIEFILRRKTNVILKIVGFGKQ